MDERLKAETRSTVIKIITIAFVVINVFVVGVGLLTPFGAERIEPLKEILFWFDISCMTTIAAYFGADVWAQLNNLKGPSKS
jgi:hypothetical protein